MEKHPHKSSILGTMQYLIPKEGFHIDFVKYFLHSIDFQKYRNGSTIPHIYFKDYKSEPFPILELDKQEKIVAILDEAFVAIDKAKANAERNLQNAKELFESYLQSVFEDRGEGWEEKTLEDICTKITDGVHKKPKNNSKKTRCTLTTNKSPRKNLQSKNPRPRRTQKIFSAKSF